MPLSTLASLSQGGLAHALQAWPGLPKAAANKTETRIPDDTIHEHHAEKPTETMMEKLAARANDISSRTMFAPAEA